MGEKYGGVITSVNKVRFDVTTDQGIECLVEYDPRDPRAQEILDLALNPEDY